MKQINKDQEKRAIEKKRIFWAVGLLLWCLILAYAANDKSLGIIIIFGCYSIIYGAFVNDLGKESLNLVGLSEDFMRKE